MAFDNSYRKRALIYLFSPLLLFSISAVAAFNSQLYETKSYMSDLLNTIAGLAMISLFITIIPFWIYAFIYWRKKRRRYSIHGSSKSRNFRVRITSGIPHSLGSLIFPPRGTLTWVNSKKTIKLTKDSQKAVPIFNVNYKDIEQCSIGGGGIKIKLNGKKYTLGSVYFSPQVGFSMFQAIYDLHKSGGQELAERLASEGVRVKYSRDLLAFEWGFQWGLILMALAFIYILLNIR
jgi:hypothetical protein